MQCRAGDPLEIFQEPKTKTVVLHIYPQPRIIFIKNSFECDHGAIRYFTNGNRLGIWTKHSSLKGMRILSKTMLLNWIPFCITNPCTLTTMTDRAMRRVSYLAHTIEIHLLSHYFRWTP